MSKKLTAFVMSVVMLAYIACPGAVFAEESEAMYENVIETEDVVSSAAVTANLNDSGAVYIYTEDDLRDIDGAENKYFILAKDIALTSEWTPISISGCVFDGGGHSIDGMTITGSDFQYAGLFSTIDGSYISDLELTDVNINISCGDDDLEYIGTVAGFSDGGEIYDCYVSGSINVSYNPSYSNLKVVNIAGLSNGTNCKTEIDINLNSYAGFVVNGLDRCTASRGSGKIYVDYYGDNREYYYRNAAGIYNCESCYYEGDVEFYNEIMVWLSNQNIICGIIGEAKNCIFEGNVYVHGDGFARAYGIHEAENCAFYGNIICESTMGCYASAMAYCVNSYLEGDITINTIRTGNYSEDDPCYSRVYAITGCKNCCFAGDIFVTDENERTNYDYEDAPSRGLFYLINSSENCCYKGDFSATTNVCRLCIANSDDAYIYGNISIKTTKTATIHQYSNYSDVEISVDSYGGCFSGTVSAIINGTAYSTSSGNFSVSISEEKGIHTLDRACVPYNHLYFRYDEFIGPIDSYYTCHGLFEVYLSDVSTGSWTPDDSSGTYTLQVLDKTTEEPLESAAVNIDGTEYTTDENGIVTVSNTRFAKSLTVEADEAYVAEEEYYIFQPNTINTVYANVFEFDADDLFVGNDASYTIQGPVVTLAGKTFNLFELPFSFKHNLFDNVKIAYDSDARVYQVIVGNTGEKTLKKVLDANGKEWIETYDAVKRAYLSDNPNDINKFFEKKNTSFGVSDCDANAFAFLQFSVTDKGELALDEGGMVVAASATVSRSIPLPPAPYVYLKFSLTGSIEAQASFTLDRAVFYDPYVEASCDVTAVLEPALGAGLGIDGIASVEAGLMGDLEMNLTLPYTSMEECTKVILSASVYIQLTLLCFGYSYAYKFTEAQLYPNTASLASLASSASLEDMEVVERNYISLQSSAPDSSTIKSSVYPYGKVKTAALSDGRVLVVWLDDDSSRATINKTAVYYSVIEDGVMSEPEQIYDDGTADYDFDLCVYNDTAAIAWQNSGSALSGSADLSDVAESINIVSSVFDGSDWSTPLSITNDTNYEYSPSIYYDGSTQYIIWTQNDVNTAAPGLEDAVESIYSASVSGESVTASYSAESIGLVYESAAYANETFAYISDADGDISTTEKSLYYCYCGSSINYYSDEEYLSGLYRDEDNVIRFTRNGNIYRITNPSGTYYTGDNEAIENMMYLTNDNGTSAVIYEVVDGFESEIYGRYNLGYGWSDQVQITDLGSKLRSWNGELNDDNTITVTAIAAEINVSGSDVSETTRLVRTSYEPDESITTEDTAIENVSIDSSVVRGETAEISFDVVNKTNSSLTSYTVAFTGETAGVIDEKSYTTSIAAQDRATITAYVTVPDDFVRQNVTVSLSTSAANGFEDNDSVTVEMGDDYITAELDGSDAASTGAMELTVTNNGCTDLTDIAISVEDDYENQLLSTSLSSLAAGEEKTYSIAVNSAYLSFGSIYDSYGVMAAVTAAGTNGTVTASDAYRARAEAVSTITADTGTSVVLKAGESITPQIEILNEATAVDTTLYVTSDDETVVSLDDNGTITAVGVGTANVAYMPLGTNYSYIIGVEVYSPGDVDCNGVVDRLDAVLVLKYIADITELDSVQLAAADYNNDGYVNMIDVTEILKTE